jgi:hypothetical protein
MNKHVALVLMPLAWATLAAPLSAQNNRPLDIAPFGTLASWGTGSEPGRLASPGAASSHTDLGIEWRDERDVHEIHVRYGATPPAVRVQYWAHTWPGPPPHMPTIEDPADDRWQGEWLTAKTIADCRGNDCTYRFEPLASGENPRAENFPGLRYRRTLKIRIVAAHNLPPVEDFSVFSDSKEKPLQLRIALGLKEQKPVRWTGSVQISNGRLRSVKPFGFAAGDTYEPAGKWSFLSTDPPKGLLVDLTAAGSSLAGSLDSTLVTVRAAAAGESRTFTFNVEDLKRGPIYVPAFHAYITDAAQPATFRPPAGKGPRIRSQIPGEPEQSYERASREIPALDPWQNQYGEPIYLLLAPDSSWQKFAFEYGGNVFISKSGTKAKGKELARLGWEGDRITWKIGTGAKPYYREDRKAHVSLADGYLPVVTQRWENEGLAYSEEAFATLLRGPLSPADAGRDEQTPAVLMLRLTAENSGASARTGHVWLNLDPGEPVSVTGRRVFAGGNSPRLRAVFDAGDAAVAAATLPGTNSDSAVHFTFTVPAGSRQTVVLKLPFVSDLAAADASALEQLAYEPERDRVAAYWRECVRPAARFSTPEQKLDLLARALIWHIRMGTTKDPASGLYMVPASGYHYQVYANEACFQVLLLDALGQHDLARDYLETLLRLQGSQSFPGLHRGLEEGIFHGARVNETYDYTASTYGLDHGTVLWTLGEHYLYTRDKEWLLHAWPHMEKAIAWIVKQREATRHLDADRTRVREYGLLPASSLEDNSDWANWFSINSFAWAGIDRAARALADIGHPDAERVRREAARYREELRTAVLRASENAPVTQLRDGTYSPCVPVEPNQRFRRFGPTTAAYFTRYGKPGVPMLRLAATREVLYGPIILLNMGVFDVNEPISNWILDDWEDNITLTSGMGLNVHGETDDRYWFSQGSMVFQANLQNPILVYLKRHEVPAALRSIYNNFAACFYPEANAFTEEYRAWSHASGPFYKTPDEARFMNRIRDTLVLEDGETLYLASGVPRRWLASREGIRADRLATYFGPVSYTLGAGAEAGTVEATVELPSRNPAKTVWLVARTPAGRIREVTINGKPWTKIDPLREAIELPLDQGKLEIRVR